MVDGDHPQLQIAHAQFQRTHFVARQIPSVGPRCPRVGQAKHSKSLRRSRHSCLPGFVIRHLRAYFIGEGGQSWAARDVVDISIAKVYRRNDRNLPERAEHVERVGGDWWILRISSRSYCFVAD